MGKFDGVLLVSDFDDTLCGPGSAVSAENLEAIRFLLAEGGRFTVATGRSLRTFSARAAALPLNAPAVLSNGAAIYDFSARASVEEHMLPARAARDCETVAAQFPTVAFETYFGEEAYVFRPNFVTRLHAERVGVQAVERPLSEIPQPWIKIILEEDTPVLKAVQRFVLSRWDAHYEAIFSNPLLLELTAKGCTKGGAVLRLARLLRVDPQHLYCIGDNQNDIPMLQVSRVGFCPSGAAREVLASGARVVGACGAHCVRDVIGILDGMYPSDNR